MIKKTLIKMTAVGTAVILSTATAVYASGKYSVSDLRSLNSFLLGKTEVTGEMDVNGDGKVNVYDLTEMRKTFVSTGVFTESVYSARD